MSQQSIKKNILTFPYISFRFQEKKLYVEIETERLYIRSYEDRDFENCIRLYSDPMITKYFDHGVPRTRKEVEDLIDERGNKYFNKGEPFGLFSLFYKENNAFIGQADLFPTEEPGTVEVGCILQKKFQHQGLGTEAVKALIVDYVNELNSRKYTYKGFSILKVLGTVHPKNTPSNKLVRKCGMRADKFQERFGNPRIWYFYKVRN